MEHKNWLVAGLLAGFSSLAFAAGQAVTADLDIIIRDFQPNHPDFENFSEEYISPGDDNGVENTCKTGKCGDNILKTTLCGGGPCVGYDATWDAQSELHVSCGNKRSETGAKIGQNGYPMTPNTVLPSYLSSITSSGPVLEYGECNETGWFNNHNVAKRGYAQVAKENGSPAVHGATCTGGTKWANPVYYTPGMVSPVLTFTDVDGDGSATGQDDMLDGVKISKLNSLCDNTFFEQWYADVPEVNLRTNAVLSIPREDKSNFFVIDYNYNNGGYFPLDDYDSLTQVRNGDAECKTDQCGTFGAQSFSIFCPPYDYQYDDTQTDFLQKDTYKLCQAWLKAGGPRSTTAAATVMSTFSDQTLAKSHLRNYNFTMMGYAKFKYSELNQVNSSGQPDPEIFEFTGDDDMWIFVDGVLVVDLGGTHLAAPGKVNIAQLAANNHGCVSDPNLQALGLEPPLMYEANCQGSEAGHWANNTWHHLHFFYADRQTDGSNMYIRTSLAELAPTKYGQPSILDFIITIDGGTTTNSMFLNTELSEESIELAKTSGAPTILVSRNKYDATGRLIGKDTLGFVIKEVSAPQNKGADGYMYDISGTLIDKNGNPVSTGLLGGDELAFNFRSIDAAAEGYVWNSQMTYDIVSKGGKKVEGFPIEWGSVTLNVKPRTSIVPQDSSIDRPDFDTQAHELTNLAGSGDLPDKATGELLVTALPAVTGQDPLTLSDEEIAMYSAAPSVDGSVGLSEFTTTINNQSPSLQQPTTSFPPVMPRCFTAGGNESCISYSFTTTQPFKVSVRVFDHLGHFVSQYTQGMNAAEFTTALASAKTSASQNTCGVSKVINPGTVLLPQGSGAMLVTVKMYPVAQNGRKIGTGPYIYQMSVIKEEYEYCYMQGGTTPSYSYMRYQRTSETYRRGYRRLNKK